MKKLGVSLLFLLLFLFAPLLAQKEILSQATIGGNFDTYPRKILCLPNGDYICFGDTESSGGGTFDTPPMNPSELMFQLNTIFLVNCKSDNTVSRQLDLGGYDGNLNDAVISGTLVRSKDGGFFLLADNNLQQDVVGTKNAPTYGGFDLWLIKLDSNYNILWQKTYGGSGDDNAGFALKELPSGSLLLTGSSNSPVSGTKSDTSQGNFDYWLIKTDSLGIPLWDKTIGSADGEEISDMLVLPNGNIVLSGITSGGGANLSPSGDRNKFYGLTDYWLVALDSNGNKIWDLTLGGPDDDGNFSQNGYMCTDGHYIYLSGQSGAGSIAAPTTRTAPVKGAYDGWLVKIDFNGSIIWDKAYGGVVNSDQEINDIEFIPGSIDMLVGGSSGSNVGGDKTEACRGNSDYWMLRIDTSGAIIWDKTIGGNDDDEMWSIAIVDSVHFLLCGSSISDISGDKTTPKVGGYHTWVVKIGASEAGINETETSNLRFYPNPVSDELHIKGLDEKLFKIIEVYDVTGKKVKNITWNSVNNGVELSLKSLQKGAYFIQITGDNFVAMEQIIKN